MKNKKVVVLGFLSSIFTLFLIFSNFLIADKKTKKDDKSSRLKAYQKFQMVVNAIEKHGVDELSIEEIIDKSLVGLLSNIDAHSSFLKKNELKDFQVSTNGEFGGLGITVGIRDGTLTVIAPIEGTPADKAGLKAGDIILKIEDKSTLNMTIDEAISLMRGKPKTDIRITIFRKKATKPIVFKIKRAIINIPSVYSKTIGSDILYLRVVKFDKKVSKEIKKALLKYTPKNKGIILDLRNNPGGLLTQAIELTDLFVKKGVIVSQRGRTGKKNRKEFKASSFNTYDKIPMTVLVNEGSASASEIVAGALQDLKRAVIIGKKTFGKGSVQVIMPISESEGIKLTIARYYLPSGRTIQAKGITPDIEVSLAKLEELDNDYTIKEADLKKHLKVELEKLDGKKVKKKKKDDKNIIKEADLKNDLQLKTAVNITRALIIVQSNK